MRKCKLLFGAVLVFLVLIQVGVWPQERYVPKDNEELYGTWIDDAATGRAYKWVFMHSPREKSHCSVLSEPAFRK